MTYKPSPRPSYSMPTHIEYNNMQIHKWGDEEAGYVDDWIYISNEKLHQIIFGLEPRGCFKHSKEFRTIFGVEMLLFGAYGARSKRAEGARENFDILGMIYVGFLMILGQFSLLISKKNREHLADVFGSIQCHV